MGALQSEQAPTCNEGAGFARPSEGCGGHCEVSRPPHVMKERALPVRARGVGALRSEQAPTCNCYSQKGRDSGSNRTGFPMKPFGNDEFKCKEAFDALH